METEILVTLITGAGGALSGAVLILYKSVVDLNKKHSELNKSLGILEGKHDGIQQLSKQVLDTVHRAASARKGYDNDND